MKIGRKYVGSLAPVVYGLAPVTKVFFGYGLADREKPSCDVNGRLKKAAGIIAHIKNKLIRSRIYKLAERIFEKIRRIFRKIKQPYDKNSISLFRFNRRNGYHISGN